MLPHAQQYGSAEAAFASLCVNRAVNRPLVRHMCYSIVDRYVHGTIENVIFEVFKLNYGNMFTKGIRVSQVSHSGEIIVFSDVYDVSYHDMEALVRRCHALGVFPLTFIKTYPSLRYAYGYEPPKDADIICSGYTRLYRGTLFGVVLPPTKDMLRRAAESIPEQHLHIVPLRSTLQFGSYILDKQYRETLFSIEPQYTAEEIICSYLGFNPHIPSQLEWKRRSSALLLNEEE